MARPIVSTITSSTTTTTTVPNVYSKMGMNYGHHIIEGSYNSSAVDTELTYIRSLGFNYLRVAFPTYSDTVGVPVFKDVVSRALSKGFYVIFGCTANSSTTSSDWSSFKNFMLTNIAPWAQSLNNANFQLSVGNEAELNADGTTLTAAAIESDIAGSYGNAMKAAYTKGLLSYDVDGNRVSAWVSQGTGSLDRIGFNAYDTASHFAAIVPAYISNFGSKAYVSEWNSDSGFFSFNDETLWGTDIQSRVNTIVSNNILGCYFTWKGGSQGVPANEWDVYKTDGVTFHQPGFSYIAPTTTSTVTTTTTGGRQSKANRQKLSRPIITGRNRF